MWYVCQPRLVLTCDQLCGHFATRPLVTQAHVTFDTGLSACNLLTSRPRAPARGETRHTVSMTQDQVSSLVVLL